MKAYALGAAMEKRGNERFWAVPKLTATFVPNGGSEGTKTTSIGPFPVLDLSTQSCAFAISEGTPCTKGTQGTLLLGAKDVFFRIRNASLARIWGTGAAVSFAHTESVTDWFSDRRNQGISERSDKFAKAKALAAKDVESLEAETQRLRNAGAVALGTLVAVYTGIALFVATIPYLQAPQQLTCILGMAFASISILAMGFELSRIEALNKTEVFRRMLDVQVAATNFRRKYRGWNDAVTSLRNCRTIMDCPNNPKCVPWAASMLHSHRRSLRGSSECWSVSRVCYTLCFLTGMTLSVLFVITGMGFGDHRLLVRCISCLLVVAGTIVVGYHYRVFWGRGSAMFYMYLWSAILESCPGVTQVVPTPGSR